MPQQGQNVGTLLNTIANALGVPPPPPPTIQNEPRIVAEVQREIATARSGQRDALWSLRRALGQARELVYIESPSFQKTARPQGAPAAWEIDLVETLRAQLAANPRLKVAICVPRTPDFDAGHAPWVRAGLRERKEAIEILTTQDRKRVAAFHPIAFPGRYAAIRSTVIIVDDVYALVGTSHFRRRGMTFDGACDVASIDCAIAEGYSAGIAAFRQRLMAAKLGLDAANSSAAATALSTRLARPESAFAALAELLTEGGLGRVSAVWAGPSDNAVLPQTDDVADPDGATGTQFLTLFASLLAEG
jgi:hypothetical protein